MYTHFKVRQFFAYFLVEKPHAKVFQIKRSDVRTHKTYNLARRNWKTLEYRGNWTRENYPRFYTSFSTFTRSGHYRVWNLLFNRHGRISKISKRDASVPLFGTRIRLIGNKLCRVFPIEFAFCESFRIPKKLFRSASGACCNRYFDKLTLLRIYLL